MVYLWSLTRSLVVVGCEKCALSFIALLCVGILWGRKKIESGLKRAMQKLKKKLAAIYFKPSFFTGVSKDAPEAVKWLRKAAEQGDADSQVNLGNMYTNGAVFPRDLAEALKWWRKAAEQGNTDALHNLGLMYGGVLVGSPVPQNNAKAYMFHNLAAAKGGEDAEEIIKDFKKGMTKDQIAEGEKLTREWLERKAKENGE